MVILEFPSCINSLREYSVADNLSLVLIRESAQLKEEAGPQSPKTSLEA